MHVVSFLKVYEKTEKRPFLSKVVNAKVSFKPRGGGGGNHLP